MQGLSTLLGSEFKQTRGVHLNWNNFCDNSYGQTWKEGTESSVLLQ